MTVARKEIVFEGAECVYHCISQCIRQEFLCGRNPYDGKSYEHRKAWIRSRLEGLADVFGIDVLAYAIMSNHIHVVLRTRPDLVNEWSAEKTARRWLTIFPTHRYQTEKPNKPSLGEVRRLAGQTKRITELRRRLGSISWFMRCLNENIARRANQEIGDKGRFWSGRFVSRMLPDEPAVLTCMAYVDLNPIRAGTAMTPEESEFTSIFERIETGGRSDWLCPIGDEGVPQRRGALSLSLEEYLTLVDWTGRQVRDDKPGAIPVHLAPLLTRLEIESNRWVNAVRGSGRLFRRIAGRAKPNTAIARKARSPG